MRIKAIILLCVFGLTTFIAAAQTKIGCLFGNNDLSGPNVISMFNAFDDASLTFVGLTPTGGDGVGGGFLANLRADVLEDDAKCIFASNARSNNISAFRVDLNDCSLTAAGPPIATGGIGSYGIGLAVDRVNRRLYAASPGSNTIAGFNITKDCSLASIGPAISGPPGTDYPNDILVDPTGSFVVVSYHTSNRLATWSIDDTGTLIPVANCSPCPAAGQPGAVTGMDFNRRGDLLFVAHVTGTLELTVVSVFNFAEGTPKNIPGSPFSFASSGGSNVVGLADDCLLLTNQGSNRVTRLNVDSDGTLTLAGPPLILPDGRYPTSMEVGCLSEQGLYPLWISHWDPSQVVALRLNTSGCHITTPMGIYPTGIPGRHLTKGIVFVAQDPETCQLPAAGP